MDYRNQVFDGQDVLLDGHTFVDCSFVDCRLIYRGGSVDFDFKNCSQNTQWVFDGPAASTIEFLTVLYHCPAEGGRELVEQLFEKIRRGRSD